MKNPKANLKKSQNFEELDQKLKNLEEDYNNFKRINPRPHLRRCSTGGSGSIITSLDKYLENSPRSLMSSLQENRRKSPMDEGFWKVRNNDIAVQEILRERRAALVSGKLKGRRLFGGSENGEEICSNCFDLLQQNEVRSVGSYGSEGDKKFEENRGISCMDSSLSDETSVKDLNLMEGGKGEMNVKQKRRVIGSKTAGNGGRWMLAMAWFAFVTMVLALGLISKSCNGGNLHEEKVILIPT